MSYLKIEDLPTMFLFVAEIFSEKKDELIAMDAKMGDGDLGITMSKGFGALPELLRKNIHTGDFCKTLTLAGMNMSSVVPSTMGTLMSYGLIEAGKCLENKTEMTPQDLALFLEGFANGIKKIGKCEIGDRTIYDAIFPAAEKALIMAGNDDASYLSVMDAAVRGAEEGVEATKSMLPKFGKAAIFKDRALGVPDQGAIAGKYFIEGLQCYFVNRFETKEK